jgi:hypothetical protein
VIAQFAITLVAVLIVILIVFWLIRRFTGGSFGVGSARGRQPRLAVLDALPIDQRRRLVLIRRDNVEHLVLIGGPSDVVVESSIQRGTPAQRRAEGQAGRAQRGAPPEAPRVPPPAPEPRLAEPVPPPAPEPRYEAEVEAPPPARAVREEREEIEPTPDEAEPVPAIEPPQPRPPAQPVAATPRVFPGAARARALAGTAEAAARRASDLRSRATPAPPRSIARPAIPPAVGGTEPEDEDDQPPARVPEPVRPMAAQRPSMPPAPPVQPPSLRDAPFGARETVDPGEPRYEPIFDIESIPPEPAPPGRGPVFVPEVEPTTRADQPVPIGEAFQEEPPFRSPAEPAEDEGKDRTSPVGDLEKEMARLLGEISGGRR